MKSILLFCTGIFLCFLCGCRTYVGSDDIIERSKPVMDTEHAKSVQEKFGFRYSMKDGVCSLQFGTEYYSLIQQKQNVWTVGRKYYYLDKSGKNVSAPFCNEDGSFNVGLVIFPPTLALIMGIEWPITWLSDGCGLVFGSSWKLHGENLPGFGYWLGYIPPTSWLCSFCLRPPYAYTRDVVLTEKVVWGRIDPVEHITEHYYPEFKVDSSGASVEIVAGEKTVRRELDKDGAIQFRLSELGIGQSLRGDKICFTVRHMKRKLAWKTETSAVIDATELRDWNLLAEDTFDPWSRIHALYRLWDVVGAENVVATLEKILSDVPLKLPTIPNGFVRVEPCVDFE